MDWKLDEILPLALDQKGVLDNPKLPPNLTAEQLTQKWSELANFEYSKKVTKRLKDFGYNSAIQHIDDATGEDVNLDFFSVQIDKLPKGMSSE